MPCMAPSSRRRSGGPARVETTTPRELAALRAYRNSRLYRSLTRTLRAYNRLLLTRIRAAGFEDFNAAFPTLLSNLDTDGTRIGVLAVRAGVTRQAAGQLLKEIQRCGYVDLVQEPGDARVTVVRFTPRGRTLLAAVLGFVDEIESEFATYLAAGELDRIREGLLTVADRIAPEGALGTGDRPPADPGRRDTRRRRR
jgi:DNA-binding MarR family transcriptional regulator